MVKMSHNQDRELQIKLVELQIRHQHVASYLTVFMSVCFSMMGVFAFGTLTIAVTTQDPSWLSTCIIAIVALGVSTSGIMRYYIKKLGSLSREIQELKKQFLW